MTDADATYNTGQGEVVPRRGGGGLGFLGWLKELIALPLRFFIWSCKDLVNLVLSLFGSPFLSIVDPRVEVQQFVDHFRENFDQNSLLPWTCEPYTAAVAAARTSIRYLIVYVDDPQNEDFRDFASNYLVTPQFAELLERNDCLLWGASVKTGEGRKVLPLSSYYGTPFVALLCSDKARTICVERLRFPYALDEMIETLQRAMDYNLPVLATQRRERLEREQAVQLRREQDQEYEQALAQDRARTQERKRQETERLERERLEEELQQRAEERRAELARRRERVAQQLPAEPAVGVTVSVRFPGGANFARKFNPDDSLEALFNTVLVHAECPDDFSLISSYPRQVLQCAPAWYAEFSPVHEEGELVTFRQAGLEGSVVVLVRDNDA